MRIKNYPLLLVGIGFAAISIILEMLFFISIAETTQDKVITASIGALMVVCQFLFAGEAVKQWQKQRFTFSTVLFGLVVVLFAISVSGTAGYFESRFNNKNIETAKSSDQYQLYMQTIKQFEQIAAMQTKRAEAFEVDGQPINAGRHSLLAQEATEKAQQAREKLLSMSPQSQTSTQAVVSFLDGSSFGIWYVLAVVVDLCPILCFMLLSVFEKNNEKVIIQKPISVQQKKQTPSQPENPRSKKDIDKVKEAIASGRFGENPGLRTVMRETGIKSYPKIRRVFDELIAEGKLIQDDKTFKVNGVDSHA